MAVQQNIRINPNEDLLMPCVPGQQQECDFEGGDVRVMEQPGLTSMHTIFPRLHNVFEQRIYRFNKDLSGEELYQVREE